VTSNVFGDFDVSATTFNVVVPRLKFVVKTPGVVWVMVLEIPPADVSDAVFPALVEVCTRDRAASNR
jgi:hypothetical protein